MFTISYLRNCTFNTFIIFYLISVFTLITDINSIKSIDEDYAAIVIQSPNYWGLLEDISKFKIDDNILSLEIPILGIL